jgi:GNAT superfamily N-acetyltransferase
LSPTDAGPQPVEIRGAAAAEIDALAHIWSDAWRDAHAGIVPAELARIRTLENFAERLAALLPDIRVAGPPGRLRGFCIVQDDELYQLFVTAPARGTGVAAALMRDAEERLVANGIRVAWLACAIGNGRAARFYEKCGWYRAGNMINFIEKPDGGRLPLEVWRYEKALGG